MKQYPLEIKYTDLNTRPPIVRRPIVPRVHVTRSVKEKTIQNAVSEQTCGPVNVWLKSLTTGVVSQLTGCHKSSDVPTHPVIAFNDDSRYCFAPMLEDVWIHWKHKTPALIKESRLELFCRINGELKRIWTKIFIWDNCPENAKTQFKGDLKLFNEVTDKLSNTGLRSVKLGLFSYDQQFPDGCVTAEFSPYELRLSVVPTSDTVRKLPESVWMYFDIRVKLELYWGEEQMIPTGRNDAGMLPPRKLTILPEEKAILRTLRTQDQGANFKIGTNNREIIIDANNFKEGHDDEYHNDFVETTKLWGDGPRLPVIAEIKVKKSDGRIELCPRAIGNAKFLWDWEDTDDTQTNPKWRNWVDGAATQETKDFLTNIFQATRDLTDPLDTDNCPTSYGGKRAKNLHPFPILPGYAPANVIRDGEFPFPIEACRVRKWAVFSKAWRSGALAGKTGVLFQPSRIAGDKYKLTVYLYYDSELDGFAICRRWK